MITMRHYELIYIVNPNLSDEDFRELVKRYNSTIENLNGIIIKTQEWGKQRLAYRIKKFYNGVYVYVEFCAENESIAEIERNLKLDDNILKFQTVKLADQADPEELLAKEKALEKDDSVDEPPREMEETATDQENQEDLDQKEESEEQNGEK
jgi:small subunit ribosomal protein S6